MKKILIFFLLFILFIPCAQAGQTPSSNLAAIRINEFMASNGDSLETIDGESPDWIELFNTADQDVNLKGLCISDGKKVLDKFVFPDVIIPAKGYLVVFASGLTLERENEIHLPFKLSADGERVVLSFEGVILDIVSFDAQEKDVSMVRHDDRSWRFSHSPTPGAANEFDNE